MVHFIAMDTHRQIFGHLSCFYGFNTNRLKRIGKIDQRWIYIGTCKGLSCLQPFSTGCRVRSDCRQWLNLSLKKEVNKKVRLENLKNL